MAQSDYMLTTLLQKVGPLPYRKYIEHFIREYDTNVLYLPVAKKIPVNCLPVPELQGFAL